MNDVFSHDYRANLKWTLSDYPEENISYIIATFVEFEFTFVESWSIAFLNDPLVKLSLLLGFEEYQRRGEDPTPTPLEAEIPIPPLVYENQARVSLSHMLVARCPPALGASLAASAKVGWAWQVRARSSE